MFFVGHDSDALERLKVELQSWDLNLEVESARTAKELRHRLQAGSDLDLIILDLKIGRDCGLKLFKELRRTLRTPVLFWTAAGDIESAVSATKMGAVGFLQKDGDHSKLRTAIEQVLREKIAANHAESRTNGTTHTMLGRSDAMQRLRQLIEEVAPTNASVLVLGENGTGKELVAQEIHRQSRRATARFVPVDIGAIPQTLLESTLFGHRKGAFTGAHATTKGYCGLADGGTLFLDEIGELALELQPKILRFLQHGVVQQVGEPRAKSVDCRVVAATNRDLANMVQQQRFRQDLYYRLNVFPIFVPALRHRPEDIEVLAQSFIRRFAQRHEKPVFAFTPAALEVLTDYDWPGNVRELENVVERMVIRCHTEEIGADMVLPELVDHRHSEDHGKDGSALGSYTARMDGVTEIERAQIVAIKSALIKTGGNASQAARRLGLGQATVYRKIKKYGIQRRDKNNELDATS